MSDDSTRPVFVSRTTAAAPMEISADTFDTWVRIGFVPPAQINRGQIIRWHWPTVEAQLSTRASQQAHDPSIVTGRYVSDRTRPKKPKSSPSTPAAPDHSVALKS